MEIFWKWITRIIAILLLVFIAVFGGKKAWDYWHKSSPPPAEENQWAEQEKIFKEALAILENEQIDLWNAYDTYQLVYKTSTPPNFDKNKDQVPLKILEIYAKIDDRVVEIFTYFCQKLMIGKIKLEKLNDNKFRTVEEVCALAEQELQKREKSQSEEEKEKNKKELEQAKTMIETLKSKIAEEKQRRK